MEKMKNNDQYVFFRVQYIAISCNTIILWHTVSYNTGQYNIMQYKNIIEYNIIQYSKVEYNTVKYNTIHYNPIKSTYKLSLLHHDHDY